MTLKAHKMLKVLQRWSTHLHIAYVNIPQEVYTLGTLQMEKSSSFKERIFLPEEIRADYTEEMTFEL